MRPFEHKTVASFEEASKILQSENAEILAGGTDILNAQEQAILESHPDTMVDIKRIPGGAGIAEDNGCITVGALTTLTDTAESALLLEKVPALAQAARSVATPLIRNMGTVGGNLCQDVRCWFYRYPQEMGGRLDCSRKGGDVCYAIQGENRYHSVFGGMKTHGGACQSACPAHTDIGSYMASIRADHWDEAARLIMNANPMPMLTSRICPHPCQDKCNQNCYGESVAIHCVERTLGDYILAHADTFYQAPEKETGKRVAVVGAGPAGLSAAYFLRKAGHAVTVIDAHEKAGGVLYYGIPHYRLPKHIVEQFTNALAGMGIEFRMNTKVGQDVSAEELVAGYDKVFFGTGAWKQPILGIAGENLTEFGLNFLVEVNSFLKKNISDDVLVCGGGNVAMDVALTAKRMGAKNVTLICLEQRKEMPASEEEVARAIEEGVVICNGWGLKGVATDAQGQVKGLHAIKCLSVYDENHRFAPVYDQAQEQLFDAKTIILATGQRVDTAFLGEKLGAQLKTARGLFDVNPDTFRTQNVKVYAGGDAVTGPNLAIRAIAAGAAAGKDMAKELGSAWMPWQKPADFLTYDLNGIKETAQAKLREKAAAERTLLDEDAQSLTMDEAKAEANRCMNCGCYSVNASDLANVLVALDATLVTTQKEIAARSFFTTKLKAYDMLELGEIIKAVKIPVKAGHTNGYIKDRLRNAIDFALIALAYDVKMEDGVIADISLVLGGVAPVPYVLDDVAALLKGKKPTAELAAQAGELAISKATPMEKNAYKVNGIQAMVERFVASLVK